MDLGTDTGRGRFVIAGTGRCGTKWTATVLRAGGVLCGHEQVFATNQLSDETPPRWGPFEGDSSLAAVPMLDFVPNARVVLLVRHPLSYIGSVLRVGPFLEGSQPDGLLAYLKREHPYVLETGDDVVAAARFWALWNMWAFQYADAVIRIEEIDEADVFEAVGVGPRWPLFPVPPTNVGPPNDRDPSWADLDGQTCGMLLSTARGLGYD